MKAQRLEDDYLNELADISAQISQKETILKEGLWDRFVSKSAGIADTAKAMGGNAKAMWSNFKNRNDPNYQKQDTKDISNIYGNKKFATLLKQYLKKIISIAEDLIKFEKSIPPVPQGQDNQQDQQGQQQDPQPPQDPSGNGGQAKALPAGKTPPQLPAPPEQGQLPAPQQQGQLPSPQQQGQLPAGKAPLQLGWNGGDNNNDNNNNNDDDQNNQNNQNESLSMFDKMYRLVMEGSANFNEDNIVDGEFTMNDPQQQRQGNQQGQQNQAQNDQQAQQGQDNQQSQQQQPNKLAQIKKDTNDLINNVRSALGGFWGAFPDIVEPFAPRLQAIGCQKVEKVNVQQMTPEESQEMANDPNVINVPSDDANNQNAQ